MRTVHNLLFASAVFMIGCGTLVGTVSGTGTDTGGSMPGGGGMGGVGTSPPCSPTDTDPEALSSTCKENGCTCQPTAVSGTEWCSEMAATFGGGSETCPIGGDVCSYGMNTCGYDLPSGMPYMPPHCVGDMSLGGMWVDDETSLPVELTVGFRNGQVVIRGIIELKNTPFEGAVLRVGMDMNDYLSALEGLSDKLVWGMGKVYDCKKIEFYVYKPGDNIATITRYLHR